MEVNRPAIQEPSYRQDDLLLIQLACRELDDELDD
jgi:hypothetical protein